MAPRPYWQEAAMWMTTAIVVSSLLIAALAMIGLVLLPVSDLFMAEQAVARVGAGL